MFRSVKNNAFAQAAWRFATYTNQKFAASGEVKVVNALVGIVGGCWYSTEYFYHRSVVTAAERRRCHLEKLEAIGSKRMTWRERLHQLAEQAAEIEYVIECGEEFDALDFVHSRRKIAGMWYCSDKWDDKINMVTPMIAITAFMRGLTVYPVLFGPAYALLLLAERYSGAASAGGAKPTTTPRIMRNSFVEK